jgi:hypothetical protein
MSKHCHSGTLLDQGLLYVTPARGIAQDRDFCISDAEAGIVQEPTAQPG